MVLYMCVIVATTEFRYSRNVLYIIFVHVIHCNLIIYILKLESTNVCKIKLCEINNGEATNELN